MLTASCHRLLVAASGSLAAFCAFAQAPSARELHSAQCVAALQVSTETLAGQVKAGREAASVVLAEPRMPAAGRKRAVRKLAGHMRAAPPRQTADEAAHKLPVRG